MKFIEFYLAERKLKSLKARVREMKEVISRTDDVGEGDTQKFIEMSLAAATCEDQIGDKNARIRSLTSDTANINATI